MGSETDHKITFGPVPSRRLGRSLGIDLVPLKTCTHDCVYCQLGRTVRTTVRRRPFRRVEVVVEAVSRTLEEKPGVDVLTFSGSGEPTLQQGLGEMISALKHQCGIPVVVITNGALLYRPEVRAELMAADRVLPSMDAWTDPMFQRINRPNPGLRLERMLEGLAGFRQEFPGEIWLEVLLVEGINDRAQDLPGLKAWTEKIRPHRIQINTAVRPPAEPWVRAVKPERLEEIRAFLGPSAEIVASFRGKAERAVSRDWESRVVEMVRRRPLAPEDLVSTLGMGTREAETLLRRLAARKGWASEKVGGRIYYRERS